MIGTSLSKQSKSLLPLNTNRNKPTFLQLKKNQRKVHFSQFNKERISIFREIVLSHAGQPIIIMRLNSITKTPIVLVNPMELVLIETKLKCQVILTPRLICSNKVAPKLMGAKSIVLEIKINRYMQICFRLNVLEKASTPPLVLMRT